MSKILVILGMVLFLQQVQSQNQTRWTEDFDNLVSFTPSPSGSWQSDTVYYLPGSSPTNPQSYRGLVPSTIGSTIVLETPSYDCSMYRYVYLKFNHICKISPSDTARIEYAYHLGAGIYGNWKPLPASGSEYKGSASNYGTTVFNATSYAQWQADNDTALPTNSWWKKEIFDLHTIAGYSLVKFRFTLKCGNVAGTDIAYGWLLENFELLASTDPIVPPTVQFIAPLVKDTVYSTGPWDINAEVKSHLGASIVPPMLKYTAMYNGKVTYEDSIPMTHVSGNSFWKATIPQYIVGTTILYSITGQDSYGNEAIASSSYTIFNCPAIVTTYSDTLCFGESYDFGGETYTVSGTYYDTLESISGCDSIISLTLTIKDISPVSGLSITESDNRFIISWSNSPELLYEIYRNEIFWDMVSSSSRTGTYIDSNLTDGTTYCYKIKAIDGDCQSELSDAVCLTYNYNDVGIVGAKNVSPLRVYPNPVKNGELRMENGELKENTVIEIFDVVGQRLNNYQLSIVNCQLIIDVSHLANGLYFLKIDNNVVKFIKE